MNTKRIMYELVTKLHNKGLTLHYYKALTTNSCYIKVDFGVCNSIRIADHRGKEKYKYKFNLMLNLKKSYVNDGRAYYCLGDLDKMVDDIVSLKKDKQEKYGFKYFEFMLKNKKELYETESSWLNAETNDNLEGRLVL